MSNRKIVENTHRWNNFKRTMHDSAMIFQDIPEIDTVNICSWHLPSGLFYIMNILIELGIYSYHPPNGHWFDVKSKKLLKDNLFYGQNKTVFPAIDKIEMGLNFPTSTKSAICTHSILDSVKLTNPTILLYRNIYGSMYSYYKRYAQKSLFHRESFHNYCSRIHSNFMPISLQDFWSLYYAIHLNLAPRSYALSFDLCKIDAYSQILDLLTFIGETRTDDEILSAIENSDVGIIKNRIAKNESYKYVAQGGDIQEFLKKLSDDDINSLDGIPIIVMDNLTGHDNCLRKDINLNKLFDLVEIFSSQTVPIDVIKSIENLDFHRIVKLVKEYDSSMPLKLIFLAIRLSTYFSGPIVEFQEVYASSNFYKLFKCVLFCISQASNKAAIKSYAEREASKTIVFWDQIRG